MKTHKHLSKIAIIGTLAITGAGAKYYQIQHNYPVQPTLAVQHTQKSGAGYLYPDPTKTPGFTNPDISQSNINQTICNKNWSTKSIRPPVSYTNKIKVKQFNAGYHYSGDKSPSDAELDHFISLELGGNPTDERNLWLESYNTQPVNAKDKDKIENLLHKEVCDGTLTLQEAQTIITSDWYACYVISGEGKKENCK